VRGGNSPTRSSRYARGDDQRTALTTHQIDTSRGGQAFEVDVTPASTDKELNARRINRKCLLSFSGCDGLGELLPGVLPVLCDRKHIDHTVLWGAARMTRSIRHGVTHARIGAEGNSSN